MTPTKPTLQRVLVPTDFSDAARSTYKVARDMTRDGGQIFLVHVAPAFPPHVEARDLEVYLEELEEALTQESCDAAFEGAEISTHLIQPGSLDIFERVHRIDLILTSTHGHSDTERAVLGSFTERLIRTATAPVLVHREGSRSHAPRNVLVPFDFSEKALRVLPLMRHLYEKHQTHFTVLYVHEIAPRNAPFYDAFHALTPDVEARVRKRFEELRREELRGVVLSLETAEGIPHFAILNRLTSGSFDLALIGTHGMPGRVAQNVTRHAPASVLAVRDRVAPPTPPRKTVEHRHLGKAQTVKPPSAFTVHPG